MSVNVRLGLIMLMIGIGWFCIVTFGIPGIIDGR